MGSYQGTASAVPHRNQNTSTATARPEAEARRTSRVTNVAPSLVVVARARGRRSHPSKNAKSGPGSTLDSRDRLVRQPPSATVSSNRLVGFVEILQRLLSLEPFEDED
jgi:hypothetical protein